MIPARSVDRTGVRSWFFAGGLSLLLIVVGCRRESSEGSRASGTESASAPSDNVVSIGRTFPMLPDAAASREALTKSLSEADAQVLASPDDAAPLLNRARVKSRLAWFLSPRIRTSPRRSRNCATSRSPRGARRSGRSRCSELAPCRRSSAGGRDWSQGESNP